MDRKAREFYVGFDESNHAGVERKGEIVVAFVSTNPEDASIRSFPNRRQNLVSHMGIDKEVQDYRFTLLTGEQYRYRSSSSNLVEVAYHLLEPFLHPDLETLKLYFDGGMSKKERKYLETRFSDIDNLTIDNFVKKNKDGNGNVRKGPRCPGVVHRADYMANYLFDLPASELLRHPRFIPYR